VEIVYINSSLAYGRAAIVTSTWRAERSNEDEEEEEEDCIKICSP